MLDSNDNGRPVAPWLSAALAAMLRASDGILDMLPIATFICDAQGTILQYNARAVEIWGQVSRPGQTHQEFTSAARYFDIDGTPLRRSELAEVLATGKPARDVERIVERMDGERVIVSLNIDPLRNAKGELVGAVNCFIDITERKRTAAALEHSRLHALEQEQRLAATYEHAAIGIAEIAPDGSFLRVNEAICAITGYGREHLLANRLFAHTHADDADADREAFRKQIGGELEFYSVEKRLNRSDGRGGLAVGALVAGARRRRTTALCGARRAGHHRAQGRGAAPEAADRRIEPSREKHAGDRAVAGVADRARRPHAGGIS